MNKLQSISFSLVVLTTICISSCKNENKTESSKTVTESQISQQSNSAKSILLNLLETERYLNDVTTLGEEKAIKPELKAISLQAKVEHKNNYETLKSICEKNGYKIPEKLSKTNSDKLYKLTVTNLSDFDNYYYQNLVDIYKINVDSTAIIINENILADSLTILPKLESNYRKNLDNLLKLK